MPKFNIHKFTKDNSFFLCHRCFYTTHLKNDMSKHYDRKTICNLKYVSDKYLTPEEYHKLSIKKRYFFDGKLPSIISNSTFIKLIKEYHNDVNYIDFYGPSLNARDNIAAMAVSKIDDDDDSDKKEDPYNKEMIHSSQREVIEDPSLPDPHKAPQSTDYQALTIFDPHNNPSISTPSSTPTPTSKAKGYVCHNCDKLFKKKESYIHHLKYGSRLCENTMIINMANKKKEEAQKAQPVIIQNIFNQNIQNNNNSNMNFAVRDFMKEGYCIDHIDPSKLDDDFYLYDNMASLVFQNDVNKNIFFQDKVAIVYTNNQVDVLPNDKAVYMVHQKMGKAADRLVEQQSPAKREDLKNVEKYYRINLDKFRHDTLYKKYDVKTKQYVYDSDVVPNLRTRDECMANVIGIINGHEERTQEIFKTKGLNTKKLPPVNQVAIEYFASVKDRYKPLKDDE